MSASLKSALMKMAGPVVALLVLLAACSKSVTNMTNNSSPGNTNINCSGTAESFSKDVSQIIQTTCATGSNCHGSGSINGPGELITYTEIQAASSQIRAAVVSGQMPKTGSLSTAQKTAIVCWIDNGSSNN